MIRVEGLSIRQGRFSLENVSFHVERGEYAVLMGRTGCGKSTVLECICGLRPLSSGEIRIHDTDVTRLKAAERGIGYVPQDAALFSTMTVAQNLGFALRIRRWSATEIATRVGELAELLGIRELLTRRVTDLSGGEAQRVALGRALSFSPEVLCLDEPMSALDEATRLEMYALLKLVRERAHVTALHVTHSMSEALALGDRLLRLEDGIVRETVVDARGIEDPS